jgi:cytochrome c oxidase subunit 1
LGYFLALLNLLYAAKYSKVIAPKNPYNSLTLEWQADSPPIHENFKEVPVVTEWPYAYGKPVES